MKNKAPTIRGNFDFIVPAVVPSFVQGDDAEALYNKVRETIKDGVWYDANSKTMKGSSTFLAARVDSIVRPLGIRVATLADLSRPEVMEMVKDKCHSDTPAVVLRTLEDNYEPNRAVIKELVPHVEQKMGRLQLPVLVTGFDVAPSEDGRGYGLKLVLRSDFDVLHDERLKGDYDCQRFSDVDEKGLPKFDRAGSRTWYARSQGLSGLYLGFNIGLISRCYGGNLANLDDNGRVVLVRDKVARAKKKA